MSFKRSRLLLAATIMLSTSVQAQTVEWAIASGGLDQDMILAQTVDGAGNLYVCGEYRMTVDFDPGTGEDLHTSTENSEVTIPYSDVFIQKFDQNGKYLWGKSIGGESFDLAKDIQLDTQGNIYLTGYIRGKVDFDPGPGVFELSSSDSTHGYDPNFYILKLTNDGDFIWAKVFENDAIGGWDGWTPGKLGIGANAIYFAGTCTDTLDANPDPQVENLLLPAEGGGANDRRDFFVVKLDLDGNYQWAHRFGSAGTDAMVDMDLDAQENMYLTGWFSDTVDFDPGTGIHELMNKENAVNGFVLKLDSDGKFVWVKQILSTDFGTGALISVDQQGGVYVVGTARDTLDFTPDVAGDQYVSTAEYMDMSFVCHFDSQGAFEWAKIIRTEEEGLALGYIGDVGVDAFGNVHVVGGVGGKADFDPDNPGGEIVTDVVKEVFIPYYLSYALDGERLLMELPEIIPDTGGMSFHRITFGPQNELYLSGVFAPMVEFNTSTGTINYVANSLEGQGLLSDYFLLKRQSPLVGIQEKAFDEDIRLYPNPTNDQIRIEGESLSKYEQLVVRDQLGRTMGAYHLGGSPSLLDLDLSTLAGGTYLLVLEGNQLPGRVLRIQKK
ncbi:MAG: hypothetical protein EP338_07350 [Bacteroidetes bacterium]|nr:MAG: hypothetical protein EP338_07350 [Bacteroidota bacterium]